MIRSRRARPQTAPAAKPGTDVLEASEFMFELLKEIHRSDRRRRDKEFGLVRLIFRNSNADSFPETSAFQACIDRLRITDCCGWYDGKLAFLLPETDRNGSLTVANDVTRICVDHEIEVDTEVSIYPQDDELISTADEVRFPPMDDSDDFQHEFPFEMIEESNSSDWVDITAEEERVDYGHFGPPGPHANLMVKDVGNRPMVSSVPRKPKLYCCARGQVTETKIRFIPAFTTPWWKRVIDIGGSALGLVMLSPVFLAAAVAIKLSSRGSIFFRQQREGKDGQVFEILKFRTMVNDAESQQAKLRAQSEQDGPAFKLTNDPRVTAIGKYLRKSCIDELPQLINILKGDMSLVGPRPLPVSESHACKAWQRARLAVLPGLTCIWQAYGGRNVKFEQWMRMDLDYIQKRSFLFDLKLILDTAMIAVMHRGSV